MGTLWPPPVDTASRGESDLLAVGRALLTDPTWAEKVRDGRHDELVPFRLEALGTVS
jgi:2,4-dienoyl-CoA reductase-like NADH-dependent reductase (Old Yellow Enzyme family)